MKNHRLLLALTFLCTLAASADPSKYEQTVLADKPAAWWRFDETEKEHGKAAADRMGTANGEFRGGVTMVPGLPGSGGKAVSFNGKDAYVQAPYPEALRSNVFSIEFWFRSTQPFKDRFWPGSAAFVSTATPGPNSEDWTISAASQRGRDEGRILGKTGPKGRKRSDLFLESRSGDPLNDGHWHHIVFTRTDSGEAKLYVNGELHITGNDGGGNILSDRPLNIGGDAIHEDGAFLEGEMDEVALYLHALNAEQVTAHFATIKPHLPERKVREFVGRPSAPEKKSDPGEPALPFLEKTNALKAKILEKADSHWAFQPIRKPALPEVKHKSWVKNPIDLFVLHKLETAGRAPAEQVDFHALLRRAHFDLLGLPPDPESIEKFVKDPDWPRLVKELLASLHYGERYARHWLDVARYADSSGRERDYFFPHAARYRDYVIRSMNEDKPFTSFVKEQIAGDILYSEDKTTDARRYATGFYTIGAIYPVSPNAIKRPKRFEYDRLTDAANVTGEAFLGLSFACARCHDHKYDPISQLDYFAFQSFFASSIFNEMPMEDGKQKSQAKNYLLGHKPRAEHATFFHRGELDSPVGWVRSRLPNYFSSGTAPVETTDDFKRRRLQLANWIVSDKNTLTARVIVNRVWQWHFGEALVATPNDFGIAGEKPTHPELLDYLASYLMENDWSLKTLHFHIMSSSTYRMSSAHFTPAVTGVIDRFPTTRMQAETIWDNMLAVSGKLNEQMFGRAVFPPISKELVGSKRNASWEKEKQERDWMRRGIYVAIKRTIHFPFFEVFNGTNSTSSQGHRERTVGSPQALAMMNGEIPMQLSAAFHERLVRECGDDKEKIIARAWLLAYGRPATEKEREVTLQFLSNTDMRAWCHALFNSNEFSYLR
jgi:hypothetical protein|tara:strand:- start:2062 stop:4719 length:2658 start_codon:yes stop_codon:yes gene_type:complete